MKPMKIAPLSALAFVVAVQAAAAQTLTPAPEPGLWENEGGMRVNGQDVGAMMRAAMAQALQSMPPAQRAQAEAMMKEPMKAFGGKHQECLTAAQVARMVDPQQMLEELRRDSPECRFEPVRVSGGTLTFKGRCDDPEGFQGDVAGEVTMTSARAWTGQWTGNGRLRGAQDMPGLKIGPDGRVEMRMQHSGRWLGASCGNVAPR